MTHRLTLRQLALLQSFPTQDKLKMQAPCSKKQEKSAIGVLLYKAFPCFLFSGPVNLFLNL